jgi:hypothetical protein
VLIQGSQPVHHFPFDAGADMDWDPFGLTDCVAGCLLGGLAKRAELRIQTVFGPCAVVGIDSVRAARARSPVVQGRSGHEVTVSVRQGSP